MTQPPYEPTPAEFLIRILIALLGGMLIGLERERAQSSVKSKDGGSIPGLRSFGLISLYGALSSYIISLPGLGISQHLIVVLAFASLSMLVILYAYARLVKYGVLGITTYIVMFSTFLVGFVAGLGFVLEAAASSVVITLVLALKMPAERIASSIRYEELLAMLEVAALALVVGPIVKAYSVQTGFTVVFKIYLFFTVILMISFTSYMTAKAWGTKGLYYSAVLGALVNSEATLSSVASVVASLQDRDARRKLLKILVPIILATALVKLSLLAIIGMWLFSGILNINLTIYSLVVASYAALIGAYAFHMVPREESAIPKKHIIEVASPLSWSSALKSAAAYTLLTGLFALLTRSGLRELFFMPILLSFLGGLVNATAVILSIGTTVSSLTQCQVVTSVLFALGAAALNKILYAKTVNLSSEEVRIVVFWSMLTSLLPFILAFYSMLSC